MARPKGQPKLGGRKKGTPNAVPAAVKAMVLQALNEQEGGGVEYLKKLAKDEPKAFTTLVAKMIPTAIEGTDGSNLPLVIVRDYRGKEGKD